MDVTAGLEFLTTHHRVVLATRRSDGGTQMSPVNAGMVDGAVVISSRAMLAKVANIRRRPEASVLVQSDGFYGSWVQLDGPAEIVDQSANGTLDLLEQVYRSIAGEHPDWHEYRAAMVRDERVVIRIRPQRASGSL